MARATAGLIKAIHAGKRSLGMDNETYRAMLINLTGRESCSGMTADELKKVLAHLRQVGFAPKPPSPQERKIRALWLLLHEAGQVKDASFKAIRGYIRRMLRHDSPAASNELAQVIETLKAWCRRTGVEYEDC